MGKINFLNCPPPGIMRDPTPATTKLPIAMKGEIERFLKEELLRPRSPLEMVMLSIPGDPQIVQFRKASQTAMAATWLRGAQMDPEAVTLILSGIDVADDEMVLGYVEELIIDGDNRDEVRKQVQAIVGAVRNQARPAVVTLHFDERSYDSQGTRVGAASLGRAFLSQFGISED